MSQSSMPPIGNGPAAGDRPPAAPPPAPSPVPVVQVPWAAPPPRRSFFKRMLLSFVGLMFLGSILLNIWLLILGVALLGKGRMDTTVIRKGKSDQVVAVVQLAGAIGNRQVREIEVFCRTAGADENVKAVVLRVDSPGGSASASDRIYRMLKDLKEKNGKTLVVSMGGVAASGAYYVSAPADEIYAEPTTVTGSIGAVAVLPGLKGTLEKIGLKIVLIRSTKAQAWKAAPSMLEEPAGYQLAELQKLIDAIHDRFETIVRNERGSRIKATTSVNPYVGAGGEKFSVKETEPYNGRVYLADRALEIGLVDGIGYEADAITAAAKLASLAEPKVVLYKMRKSFRQELGLMKQSPVVNLELLEEIQTPRLMLMWKVGL